MSSPSAVSRRSGRLARMLGAAVVTAVFALPLVFMVVGSLRAPGLPPPRTPSLLPDSVSLESFDRAFTLVDLARYTLNSVVVAAVAVPLTVLVASWAGFVIAQLPRRLATVTVTVSIVALMVPVTALVVPRFAIYRTLGLTDTWAPLVAPALIGMSPLYVLLYAWAFGRLPRELYDACRLEAMQPFTVWRRIAMPLVRPVTVAVATLAFVVSWGSVIEPLVYLFDPDLYTLPLGLRSLAELDRSDYPVFLAGCVVATAPVVAALLVAQRWFLHEGRSSRWLGP